jgi:hypothetical protein
VGDEGVQEAGTALHLLEPGPDDHGGLIEMFTIFETEPTPEREHQLDLLTVA